MFSKKKIEDQFEKIIDTTDIVQKAALLKKQIEFFKSQNKDFEYEYKDFLTVIDEFHTSTNYEYNLLWLQIMNEIVRLNPSFTKRYFKIAMKIIFPKKKSNNEKENEQNYEENKEEIYGIKVNALNLFTNKCEDILTCDTYFILFYFIY